jgi:predicted amidohydrolase
MREVRVCSIQPLGMAHISPFEGESDRGLARRKLEGNIDQACRLLEEAGRLGCDIACYPEDIQGIGHYGYYLDDPELFSGFAEPVPGPTTERMSAVARAHHMHVVFTVYERLEGRVYNSAVLLGRSGEIIGRYHKVHLPAAEAWGVAAGKTLPVFPTDFGTVGMLTCYDIMFPEVARCLVLNGAEILFNPTMGFSGPGQCEGNGLLRIRMRAIDNFLPFVLSKCGSGTIIVDSDGSILAQARPGKEDVISATVDLDGTPQDHSQWEVITGTADVKARFLQERRPALYGCLTETNPPMLDRYGEKRLRSTPEEIREAYEEIRRRWSPGRAPGVRG